MFGPSLTRKRLEVGLNFFFNHVRKNKKTHASYYCRSEILVTSSFPPLNGEYEKKIEKVLFLPFSNFFNT